MGLSASAATAARSTSAPSCHRPASRYSAAVSAAVAGCWFMVSARRLGVGGVAGSQPALGHHPHVQRIAEARCLRHDTRRASWDRPR